MFSAPQELIDFHKAILLALEINSQKPGGVQSQTPISELSPLPDDYYKPGDNKVKKKKAYILLIELFRNDVSIRTELWIWRNILQLLYCDNDSGWWFWKIFRGSFWKFWLHYLLCRRRMLIHVVDDFLIDLGQMLCFGGRWNDCQLYREPPRYFSTSSWGEKLFLMI